MNPKPLGIFLVLLVAAALSLASAVVSPVSVWALVGDTGGVFGLDGRVKTFILLSDYSALPSFFKDKDTEYTFQTDLRLMMGGRPWKRLSYEAHLVQGLNLNASDAEGFSLKTASPRYQALHGILTEYDEGDAQAVLRLDRLNIKFSLPWADLTVGRQAITFGKAYFWNPLDVFSPFAAEQFERDYKSGVDAVRLDIPVGNFSGINLIGAFGREISPQGSIENQERMWDSSWFGSALLFRCYTTIATWDLALQGGKIYGGYQIGGGTVGEIGPLEIRLEAAYFWPEGQGPLIPFPLQGQLLEDHWTAVFGLGRYFENTFNFELEYLFNGGGDPGNLEVSLARLNYGSILHMSRHLLGLMASYDIIPILNGRVVWIYSLSDQSSFLQPVFTLSLSDEADLLFGAALGTGSRPCLDGIMPRLGSEFGSYPDFYFVELKYYF